MPIERNDLESARFGIVAGRLIDPEAGTEAIDIAARQLGLDMLTVRVPVSDLPRVHAFEEAGYRLMDTLVYFRRGTGKLPSNWPMSRGITCREATAADMTAVTELARIGFSDYMGHYHADPRLDSTAADAAYAHWAETSIANVSPSAPVLLAESAGRTVGFLTLRQNSMDEIELVLSAVDPSFMGRGVYPTLIAEGIIHAAAHGYSRVITSTQINNYAVQSAWTRLGFRHERSFYTFHKWWD